MGTAVLKRSLGFLQPVFMPTFLDLGQETKIDSICDVKQQQKHYDITFGLCHQVALSSSAVVNNTCLETDAPITVHFNELNPNIRIMVVDKNT